MPLFRRPDGAVVRDLSPARRLMPYLMPGRNESLVYYEQVLDLSRTLPFLARWNESGRPRITVFHLVVAGIGRVLFARPGLNRFVSGGRIYQRKGVFVSFAAKRSFADDAPLLTVKLELVEGEALERTVERIHAAVREGRSGAERPVDREMRLALRVPAVLLRLALAGLRLLDRWNLLPASFIANDPLYASVFVANLGSVGIDRAWHHLYEYGTVSVFAAIGQVRKDVVVGEDGAPAVRDTLRLLFAFDERIHDGFYCASSLELLRRFVEDPEVAWSEPRAAS